MTSRRRPARWPAGSPKSPTSSTPTRPGRSAPITSCGGSSTPSGCPNTTCGKAGLPPQTRIHRRPPRRRVAALAISHRTLTDWTIKKFVRALRRYRTLKIDTGSHTLTAEDPLPDDLRQALAEIHHGSH